MGKIIELTNDNFKAEILENEGVALIDFWAAWCMPCKMIGPVIEELSEEMPNVKFGKVNVDEQNELAVEYGIRSIPALYIYKDGKKVDQLIGAAPKQTLSKKLEKYI